MNSHQFERVALALNYLEANQLANPCLEEIGQEVGLSEFHLQRLFVEGVGVSPKEFLDVLRIKEAKLRLSRYSNLHVSEQLGLSSSSRLHDLFTSIESISPGEYRAGGSEIKIRWAKFTTPLGDAILGKTWKGVCHFSFLSPAEDGPEVIQNSWPMSHLVETRAGEIEEIEEIKSRLMHGTPKKPIGILMKGSPYRIQVWRALLNIPQGMACTYQDIALAIHQPQGSRAVGSAIGSNEIAYLIPCHRVIQASGVIGQYRWDHARKAALLAREWVNQP